MRAFTALREPRERHARTRRPTATPGWCCSGGRRTGSWRLAATTGCVQAVAEVAFTVAEDLQGRGVATRILEQLAEIGAEQGIRRFDAEVMDTNQAMLAVFGRAGFGVRSKLDFDELLVSLDIQPTEAVQERIEEREPRRGGGVAPLDPRARLDCRGRGLRRAGQPGWRPVRQPDPRRLPGGARR